MSMNSFPFEARNITESGKYWRDVRFYLFNLALKTKDKKEVSRLRQLAYKVPNIDKKDIPEWVLEQVKLDRQKEN